MSTEHDAVIKAGITLSAGSHVPGFGEACLMEYVSLFAGEDWSDRPACTHPVLAAAARSVNDRMTDDERHLLVPLIGRLFGTAQTGTEHEQHVLNVRLAAWCARHVLRDGESVSLAAIEAAEGWCEGTVTAQECRAAATAIEAAEGWCEGTVTAQECRAAATATATVANAAANAAAYAAAAYAYATDAAAYAANAADADLPAFLTGLIDEYDRLTGRTEHRHVSATEYANLAQAVAR